MSISYAGNLISARDDGNSTVKSKQQLASKLLVGERFFAAQVVNIASATADWLTTRMPTNGAFRVLVFPGNVAEEKAMQRLQKLASYLDGAESVVSKYTPASRPRSSVIDVITIREFRVCACGEASRGADLFWAATDSSDRHAVPLYDFPQPSIFPSNDPHTAYKKVYVDGPCCEVSLGAATSTCPLTPRARSADFNGDGKAYEKYGISKEEGAIVVVRPDQCTPRLSSPPRAELTTPSRAHRRSPRHQPRGHQRVGRLLWPVHAASQVGFPRLGHQVARSARLVTGCQCAHCAQLCCQ